MPDLTPHHSESRFKAAPVCITVRIQQVKVQSDVQCDSRERREPGARTQGLTRTRPTAPADSLMDVWSNAARSVTLAQQVVLKQYSMGLGRLEYQFMPGKQSAQIFAIVISVTDVLRIRAWG